MSLAKNSYFATIMNSTMKKTVAGASAGGLAVFILHAIHVIHIGVSRNRMEENFKIEKTPLVIVITDSTGKKDTVPLEEYLKANQKK